MTITGITTTSLSSSGTSDSSSLTGQMAKLDAEIRKVTNDKSLDAKSKETKLEALEMEKAQLQAQIDRARQRHRPEAATQTAKSDEEQTAKSDKPADGSSIHVVA